MKNKFTNQISDEKKVPFFITMGLTKKQDIINELRSQYSQFQAQQNEYRKDKEVLMTKHLTVEQNKAKKEEYMNELEEIRANNEPYLLALAETIIEIIEYYPKYAKKMITKK